MTAERSYKFTSAAPPYGASYGETFIEQGGHTYDNPYKFTPVPTSVGRKELDEETGLYYYGARYYDPKISLWLSVDPLAEKYPGISPFAYTYGNPVRFADPTGMEGEAWDDKIFINQNGEVVKVIKDDGPNEFYDAETGEKLQFNDPEGVDWFMVEGKYKVGDKIYIPISQTQINEAINNAGLIKERLLTKHLPIPVSIGMWITSLVIATKKSYSGYDFAQNYLVHFVESPAINFDSNIRNGRTFYHSESGYFRFGNSNTIYNLYDAGNYMWGRAMRLSGFSYFEVWLGSNINEIYNLGDSAPDQRAIKNGFYGL